MMARGFDRKALAGKVPAPDRRVQVLVIGAGPAGVAAAREAAKGGESVLLVDENPVGAGLMGLDTPLYYGGRYSAAVQTKARMLEQVFASRPELEAAYEAGVEIELGVYCWGAWVSGPGLASLPESLAGLADDERSWMVGFERLILATGARDVAVSFVGWDQPGVMGARALHALVHTYDAFAGRRLIVLGSGDLALRTALFALANGLQVAAVIEVNDDVQGPRQLADQVAAAGVEILVEHAPVRAQGGLDGVESLAVRPLRGGNDLVIACDTIVQAIGVTPVIELLDVLGAELAMQPALGGHAPVSSDQCATSLPNVFLAGDVAGIPGSPADAVAYGQAWMRVLMAVNEAMVIVCQCEGVTRDALLGVRQPAYLGAPPGAAARRDLGRLLEDGPAQPDQVKRLTRAGMGPCQGRRCREQVAFALACAANEPAERLPMASYRAPVRPLPLQVLAAWDEAPAMSSDWDVWFGIPGQWTPYGDIGTDREALHEGLLGGDTHL